MHTLLDDGALFDKLDVLESRLKFVVVGCALTLTIDLLLIFSSLLIGSVHSRSTEDGEHIVIDLENLGLSFGLNFMAQEPQDSFGFDLTYFGLKFNLNDHLHSL